MVQKYAAFHWLSPRETRGGVQQRWLNVELSFSARDLIAEPDSSGTITVGVGTVSFFPLNRVVIDY